MLLIAAFLSFLVKDAITVFADCLLPNETVSLTLVPCLDDEVRGVQIVKENKQNEAFDLFRDALAEQADGEARGWIYNEGELGVSWTRIETATEGAVLQASVRANSNYYISMIADPWSGAVDLRVNDRLQEHVECFKDVEGGEIVRAFPFREDKRLLFLRIGLHILAVATFYLLIFLVAEHSDREDEQERISNSNDIERVRKRAISERKEAGLDR